MTERFHPRSAPARRAGEATPNGGPESELQNLRQENALLRHALRSNTVDVDALTGIPTLTVFRLQVRQALARARRRGSMVAVVLLDLERFGRVNEVHGHAAGDRILRQVAERLAGTVRESDIVGRAVGEPPPGAEEVVSEAEGVSRLGGDKFMVLLDGLSEPRQAHAAVERILDRLADPLPLRETTVSLAARAGISLYPSDGLGAADLLRKAEAAIHHGAPDGSRRIRYFSKSVADRQRRDLELEASLRQAIESGAFALAYQPKVDAADGRLLGFEALLRYTHPKLGPVPAPTVIEIAESTGLIHDLGAEIFRKVCRDALRIREVTGQGLRLFTNFSPRQLESRDWSVRVEKILAETRVDPTLIGIEITESVLVEDKAPLARALEKFAGMGIEISLDDFGTGYSHLGYLARMTLHEIKIDRSFVSAMTARAESSREIAGLVVILGRTLGLRVVAEGAETSEQVEMLRALGCHTIQGYWFARPAPLETFFPAIREGRITPAGDGPPESKSDASVSPGVPEE